MLLASLVAALAGSCSGFCVVTLSCFLAVAYASSFLSVTRSYRFDLKLLAYAAAGVVV